MKLKVISGLIIVLIGLSLLIGCSGTASPSSNTIELRVSHHLPPTHILHSFTEEILSRTEQEAGGKVKFTIYPAGSLVAGPEAADGVISGTSDIDTAFVASFAAGRFPRSEVITLPPAILHSSVSSPLYWEYYNDFLKDDWEELKVLGLYVQPAMTVHSIDKPVRTMEDLKGMQIRVPGPIGVRTAEALGATPVAIPMPETYEALQKKVCDGVFVGYYEINTGWNLGEVTSYHTDIPVMAFDFWVIMNKDKYNSLPSDVKKAFDKWGEWVPEIFGGWDVDQDSGREWCQTTPGHEFITLSADEEARWQQVLQSVPQSWAADMEAKGMPGEKLVAEKLKLLEKAK